MNLDKALDHVRSAMAEFEQAREAMTQQERYNTVNVGQALYTAEYRLKKALGLK